MILQSITAGVVLLVVAHWLDRAAAVWGMKVLVWLTVAVTTLSMLQYLIRSKDVLSETTRP